MSAGYQVLDSEGTTSAGTGQADATRWLQGFDDAARSSHDGYRLLYGSPDIAALVHDGQESVLDDAANANKLVESTRSLPLLILPGGGAADAATLQRRLRLCILLRSCSPTPPPGVGGAGTRGPEGVPIIRFAAAANKGGPGPDPRETAVHVHQRMLADSWIEAATAALTALNHGKVRLITKAAQAARR